MKDFFENELVIAITVLLSVFFIVGFGFIFFISVGLPTFYEYICNTEFCICIEVTN